MQNFSLKIYYLFICLFIFGCAGSLLLLTTFSSCRELWCWKRLLRVPWTARRSNQSVLKEINPEYSSDGLMLKPKFQYFGHLIQRTDSLENTMKRERLRAGEEAGNRGWYGWMASLTQWTWVWTSSKKWPMTGKPGVLQSMGSQRVG